jgi:beta-lactamase class A
MSQASRKTICRYVYIACLFIVSVLIGRFSYAIFPQGVTTKNIAAPVEVRANLPQYTFINPLIVVSTNKTLYAEQYKDLVSMLDTYIQNATKAGMAQNVSVYFRDMNTGHWTGIGEKEPYHPSSMLKVLTLMATAQLAENSVLSLTDMLPYAPGDNASQYYPPTDVMATGTYSIQDLARATALYSDNSANAALLSDSAINNEFTALYKLFRLPDATSSTEDFMSPQSYSVIWRSLYNATLLSDPTSEELLQLLSYTTFKDGLVAGVPANITISHKFGEFSDETTSGAVLNRELHDCGIVYYPGHPYLLCVMTRGTIFPNLAQTIAGVSRLVYNFVASSTQTTDR